MLGSHMLEVCPSIAAEEKPILDVQHLGIGGKDDPARLIFNTQTGPAIVASLIDPAIVTVCWLTASTQ